MVSDPIQVVYIRKDTNNNQLFTENDWVYHNSL